jgi:hypothetical protein
MMGRGASPATRLVVELARAFVRVIWLSESGVMGPVPVSSGAWLLVPGRP